MNPEIFLKCSFIIIVTCSIGVTNQFEFDLADLHKHVSVPNVRLSSGNNIPVIGFGTWQSEGQELIQAIKDAIAEGFRHLDTSWFFHNEREIGQALQDIYKEGVITREDLFIAYKVWPKNTDYSRTLNVVKNAIREVNTTYFDLISIQWPINDNSEIYRALEKAYEEGLARSIGVSNFKPSEIDELMKTTKVKPAINHIRVHPEYNQDETIDYCHKNNISIGAWSPLGSGYLIKHPILVDIGKKYGKSSAQVMIRWHLQRGLVVIPKSTKKKRIEENFDVFDFELSDKDMKAIHSMPQTNIIDFWG